MKFTQKRKILSSYTYPHDFLNPFVFPFSMRQDEEILKDSHAALFSYNEVNGVCHTTV